MLEHYLELRKALTMFIPLVNMFTDPYYVLGTGCAVVNRQIRFPPLGAYGLNEES